ncbi:MAG TPA: hypothetical protein VI790_04745, partial [Candidatus Nanoarchaeia archaeon]|nr:hypothetical protein [Candidatus Nanoarchaeia archaeon]
MQDIKKLVIIFSLISIFTVSLAHATTPPGPQGDGDVPLKERLEAFYDDKESYIDQKRQCKEEVMITQAPSGTCWTRLRHLMINLLLKQLNLTHLRLVQLNDKNITFPNINDINNQLSEAKTIFENQASSKYLVKSTAKNLEDLVNDIEKTATWNQTEKLITQMDKLMVKADDITVKLEAKLSELKVIGIDVTELESSLNDYKIELASTKDSVINAKAKYAEMNSADEISVLASEVRTFINN